MLWPVLIFSCLFLTWCHAARLTIPQPSSDQVHLSLVEALIFQSDRNVTLKNGTSVHEMECVARGGRPHIEACYPHRDSDPVLASLTYPAVIICRNDGYDAVTTHRYRWNCSVESSNYYGAASSAIDVWDRQLVVTEVLCDGVHHAHDPVVLHATCRLRYQLLPPPTLNNIDATVPTTCRGTDDCRQFAHLPPCPLPATCEGQCGHQCVEYAIDWETLTFMGRVRDNNKQEFHYKFDLKVEEGAPTKQDSVDKKEDYVGRYTIDIPWEDPLKTPGPVSPPPKQDSVDKKEVYIGHIAFAIPSPPKQDAVDSTQSDQMPWDLSRITRKTIKEEDKDIDSEYLGTQEYVIIESAPYGGSYRAHHFPAVMNPKVVDIEQPSNNDTANATTTNTTNHTTTTPSCFFGQYYFPDYWLKPNSTPNATDTSNNIDADDVLPFIAYCFLSNVWSLVRFLPLIVLRVVGLVWRIIMTLLVGLLTGDPIGAASKFVSGVRDDLFGGLGSALLNFIVILWRGTANMMIMLMGCILLFIPVFALCSGAWYLLTSFQEWPICRPHGTNRRNKRKLNTLSQSRNRDGSVTCTRAQLALPEETLVKRDLLIDLLYSVVQSLEPEILLTTHDDSDAERCLDYLDARQTRFVTKSQPAGSRHEADGQWFLCQANNGGTSLFTPEGYRFVHHVLRCSTTKELEQSRTVTGALVESFCKPLVLPLPGLSNGCKEHELGLVISPQATNRSVCVTQHQECADIVYDTLLTIAPLKKCGTSQQVDGVLCDAMSQSDLTFSWHKPESTVTLVIADVKYVFKLDAKSPVATQMATLFDAQDPHLYVECCYRLKFQSILDRLIV